MSVQFSEQAPLLHQLVHVHGAAAAVLLYFSARPPMDFYVIGIAAAFLGVLFFETPMIALDIRRQITDAEHEKPSEQGIS